MRRNDAEAHAAGLFLWLTGDSETLGGFLAQAGLAPGDLAAIAARPEFLAAVVDFVMQEDDRVIAAAAAIGLPPQAMLQIRAALPGGQAWHWT